MILTLILLILTTTANVNATAPTPDNGAAKIENTSEMTSPLTETSLLYERLGLHDEGLDFEAFRQAHAGYQKIGARSKDILTLIDYSKSSSVERMYVIDMRKEEILFKTHVAHGRNSGDEFATSFSNVNGSYKSSPGFFLTQGTYQGRNGYSLRIDGLEKGINDQALSRAIVMHGSKYADPSVALARGKLGRSLGCPAIPHSVTRAIIDTIKNGSVIFIYPGNDRLYASNSPILTLEDVSLLSPVMG